MKDRHRIGSIIALALLLLGTGGNLAFELFVRGEKHLFSTGLLFIALSLFFCCIIYEIKPVDHSTPKRNRKLDMWATCGLLLGIALMSIAKILQGFGDWWHWLSAVLGVVFLFNCIRLLRKMRDVEKLTRDPSHPSDHLH